MSNIEAFGSFTREAVQQTRDRMKSSAEWIKFKLNETKIIRILPPLAGEALPWVIIHQHFIKVPGQDSIIFNCPRKMSNSRCPACEKRDKLMASGRPGDEQLAKEFKPSVRAIARAIDRDSPEAGIRPVGLSSTVMARLSHFREKLGKDFTHPENGYDLAIERVDGSPWYNVDLTDQGPLARTDQGLADVVQQAQALPLAGFAKVMSWDEIVAKFNGQPQVQAAPASSPRAIGGVNTSSDPF